MSEKILKATHSGELHIGDITIPCAVLDDGTRLITQRGIYGAIGRHGATGGIEVKDDAQQLPRFLSPSNLRPYISNELECACAPLKFKPKGGTSAYGYKAEILPEICNVYLDARKDKKLKPNQEKFADRCELLLRGFARIGIIALVDEATGYQEDRDREELQKILAAYISEELMPWTKRFPDIFYKELFRLKNWQFSPLSVKRPGYVGKLTNQLVYEKLPKGVLDELRKKNPVIKPGRRKHRHHQFLTENIGNPHLDKHLASVITLMRVAPNWRNFESLFNRAFGGSVQTEFEFMKENDKK
jgi:hypothetical protein